MQCSALRLCRQASRAVVVQKPSASSIASQPKTSASVGVHRATAAAVGKDIDRLSSKMFAGSGSGTSYAPDGGVLGDVLMNRQSPKPMQRDEDIDIFRARPVAAPAAPPPALSFAELKQLPVSELQRMLKARAVAGPAGAEKEDLVRWVEQHQDLPEKVSQDRAPHVPAQRRSMSELRKMSVKELNEMLDERGVPRGSATDKKDLVTWVWQHSDLPVLYTPKARTQNNSSGSGRGRWCWSWEKTEPYDSPRQDRNHKPPDENEQIEGEKPELLEAGASQKLLTGAVETEQEQKVSLYHKLCFIGAGVGVAIVGLLGMLAYNDAQRASEHRDKRAAPLAAE